MLPVSQQDLSTAPGPAVLRSSNHKASGVSTDGQHPGPASIHSHYSAPIPPPPFSKVQRAAASHGHRDVASAATSIVSLTSNTVLRTRHALSKAAVPFGAVITPLPDLTVHSLPLLQRSPTACSACGAYMNAHCKVLMKEDIWLCSFCHQQNAVDIGVQDLRSAAELQVEAVDYIQPDMTGQPVSQTAETLALLVDTTAGAAELQAAKTIIKQLLQQLPRAWRLMFLTFSSAVSVYQLGHDGLVTADVVSGEWQPAMNSSKQQQQQQHAALPIHDPEPLHVASLQSCQGAADKIIDSWRSLEPTRASREQPRCLGSALAVALHLLAAGTRGGGEQAEPYGSDSLPVPQACRPSRVLLVTTGPATKGPGRVPLSSLDRRQGPDDPQAAKQAQHFFARLAEQAGRAGVAVDLVAVGQAAVNVPLLGPLAQKTGGFASIHQRFDELSGVGLATALMRRQGMEGFLDIHTSTGLGVTHVTGPLAPLVRRNLSSSRMQQHSKPTMNACEMVSVETGQAIAVGLEVTKNLEGDYAFMQVVLSWRSLQGGWLQRVVSRRVSTTGSLQTVTTGTNWSTAAVLAGKRWVRQAQASGAAHKRRAAQQLRKQIGQHVSQVVSQAGGGPSTWGPLTWLAPPPPAVLPPYLHSFAQVMYQLQRGPMLGEVAGHADERALLHSCFLAASSPAALLMMAPALYRYSPTTDAFQQVPALDLALRPGETVILDCGNQIFTRPSLASKPEAAHTTIQPKIEAFLRQLMHNRVPAPSVLRLHQDSPDVRYLATRLMPTWGDSLEEQQQQYPALLNLAADPDSARQQHLLPTDEPSFNQWARSLHINPTGAVENIMEAMQNLSVTNELDRPSEGKSEDLQCNAVEV